MKSSITNLIKPLKFTLQNYNNLRIKQLFNTFLIFTITSGMAITKFLKMILLRSNSNLFNSFTKQYEKCLHKIWCLFCARSFVCLVVATLFSLSDQLEQEF